MKEMARYAVILGAICFLAGGLLSVINRVTEPKIQYQKERKEKMALEESMPGTEEFVARTEGEEKLYYLAYGVEHALKGFVVKCEGKGYSSEIETIVSLNRDLEIISMKVLFHSETPGLGTRITEPAFANQFKGKGLASLEGVDVIAGATISSSAVIKSITDRVLGLKERLAKELKDAR